MKWRAYEDLQRRLRQCGEEKRRKKVARGRLCHFWIHCSVQLFVLPIVHTTGVRFALCPAFTYVSSSLCLESRVRCCVSLFSLFRLPEQPNERQVTVVRQRRCIGPMAAQGQPVDAESRRRRLTVVVCTHKKWRYEGKFIK